MPDEVKRQSFEIGIMLLCEAYRNWVERKAKEAGNSYANTTPVPADCVIFQNE